jgi:hypothetical protein
LSWDAREEATAGLELAGVEWRRENGRGDGLDNDVVDVDVEELGELEEVVDVKVGSAESEEEEEEEEGWARAEEMNQCGSAFLPGGGFGALYGAWYVRRLTSGATGFVLTSIENEVGVLMEKAEGIRGGAPIPSPFGEGTAKVEVESRSEAEEVKDSYQLRTSVPLSKDEVAEGRGRVDFERPFSLTNFGSALGGP